METIDIQSRSFVVRWVECSQGDVISYQVKPLKKSIELGIYKKPKSSVDGGSSSAVHIAPDTRALLNYTTKSFLHRNSTTSIDEGANSSSGSISSLPQSFDSRKVHGSLSLSDIQQQSQEIPLREKLQASGFTMVQWIGHVSGNELQQGLLKVKDDDYYYAFILDNTSAKNAKKKILFNAKAAHDDEIESLEKVKYPLSPASTPKAKSMTLQSNDDLLSVDRGRYLQGYLLKKRRKKLQGFKKRFFSLDFKYGTLSYYLNEHNQTCRGEIVINLSTVSANKKDKLLIIDSGMELWVIKAKDTSTWTHWVEALQTCFDRPKLDKISEKPDRKTHDDAQEKRHEIFNSLKIGKKDPSMVNVPLLAISPTDSAGSSPLFSYNELTTNLKLIQQRVERCKNESLSYIHQDRIDKHRPSHNPTSADNVVNQRDPCESVDQLVLSPGREEMKHPLYRRLTELETFLTQFVQQSKTLLSDASNQNLDKRLSSMSGFSDGEEFFDAEDEINHGVIILDNDESLEEPPRDRTIEDENVSEDIMTTDGFNVDLYPLPWKKQVKRRNDIPVAIASPPSLLSFLRKNVGKDLSSVAMPVTSNEPISILQMISETFEYSDLLNKAIDSNSKTQILTYVSAFAISCLSIHRDKTRALRKPFNPLLGETYELVREDMGYRLLAEKVSHRPPIFAFHADHPQWECSYTVSPLQRFWGKSVELNNEGTFHLKFKDSKDSFEWVQPTTMLKNLIAGERYVEPINEFEVNSPKCGSSTVAFQGAGMFGGRSENLTLTLDPVDGNKRSLQGKWTESLVDDTNTVIWRAGKLVTDSKKKYGFTVFTANLNEITEIERGNLPPTDSRLRPDIKAYEQGQVDEAESLKLKLEHAQRERRSKGLDVKAKFFEKTKSGSWKIIQGPNGYWERRKRRDWSGVTELW